MSQPAIDESTRTAASGTEDSAAVSHDRRDVLILFSVLVLTWFLAYLPVLRMLANQWGANDTYSFGVLVPFISTYLVWLRRERLRTIRLRPQLWTGSAIVGAAGALLVIGRVTAIVGIQEVSLVLMLVGLIVLMLGGRILRELWFPLAYLLLMLPIWDVLTDRLHRESQLFSAALAQQLLRAAGIPVHREDVYLAIPNLTIEVASACSGVNFLIAVLMIGIPQAYLYLRGLLPRVAVVVLAVGIAFLSNGLRVAIIAVLAYHKLSASLHGPWHMLQGLFVSSIGFVALFVSVWLLAKRYPHRPEPSSFPLTVSAPVMVIVPRPSARARRAAGIAMGILIGASLFRPDYSGLVQAAGRGTLPGLGADWTPVAREREANVFAAGETDTALYQAYRARTGEVVNLYLGRLVYLAPRTGLAYRSLDLPGNTAESEIQLVIDGTSIRVNHVMVTEGRRRRDLVMWYDIDGQLTAQRYQAKAVAAWQLLMRQPPRANLVVISADERASSSVSQTLNRFAIDLVRSLRTQGRSRS